MSMDQQSTHGFRMKSASEVRQIRLALQKTPVVATTDIEAALQKIQVALEQYRTNPEPVSARCRQD